MLTDDPTLLTMSEGLTELTAFMVSGGITEFTEFIMSDRLAELKFDIMLDIESITDCVALLITLLELEKSSFSDEPFNFEKNRINK